MGLWSSALLRPLEGPAPDTVPSTGCSHLAAAKQETHAEPSLASRWASGSAALSQACSAHLTTGQAASWGEAISQRNVHSTPATAMETKEHRALSSGDAQG